MSPDLQNKIKNIDHSSDSKFDAYKTYISEVLSEMNKNITELYNRIGIDLYDGGLFDMAQNDSNLDGGNFTDTDLIPFDCGEFTESVTAIDCGTY